jgi:hypothetical protein
MCFAPLRSPNCVRAAYGGRRSIRSWGVELRYTYSHVLAEAFGLEKFILHTALRRAVLVSQLKVAAS